MTKNKMAALLLVLFSLTFIFLVFFIEKVSTAAIGGVTFLTVAMSALVLYLNANRLSKPKQAFILLFFIVSPLFMLFMHWLRQ